MARFKERIATARKYLPDFGLSAYCGFGRRPVSELPNILADHMKALEIAAQHQEIRESKGTEYDIILCRKRLAEPTSVSWAKMRQWVKTELSRLKLLLAAYKANELSDADIRTALSWQRHGLPEWPPGRGRSNPQLQTIIPWFQLTGNHGTLNRTLPAATAP